MDWLTRMGRKEVLTVDDCIAAIVGCAAVGNPSGGLPGNSISPETQSQGSAQTEPSPAEPKSQVRPIMDSQATVSGMCDDRPASWSPVGRFP